jgi:hypothetical protein
VEITNRIAHRRQTAEKPPKNLYKIEEEAAAGRSMLVLGESKRIRRTMESFKKLSSEWMSGEKGIEMSPTPGVLVVVVEAVIVLASN